MTLERRWLPAVMLAVCASACDGDEGDGSEARCDADRDCAGECAGPGVERDGECCASGAFDERGSCVLLEWVKIAGASFWMGSEPGAGDDDEAPRHEVQVAGFDMTRSEVTVWQYRECVRQKACGPPEMDDPHSPDANWEVLGRARHPVNSIDWQQASDFCEWAGGRLPSEAEWEFAARSRGQDRAFPWGDEPVTCERAVIGGGGGDDSGCGMGHAWPVCSKPAGNSEQGLCDLTGNVAEWVADDYHPSYAGAPNDGSAWLTSGSLAFKVLRLGDYATGAHSQRAADRSFAVATDAIEELGFRCAKDGAGAQDAGSAAGDAAIADAGASGTAVSDCPSQAGDNPRVADCEEIGAHCTVRDACGVCLFEPDCDYYESGPQWDYADPLQNSSNPQCPASMPQLGASCSFTQSGSPCQYCEGAVPQLRACLEGAWRSVTRSYCP